MASTKNYQFCDPRPPPSQKWTIDLLFENNRIRGHVVNFPAIIINVWSLNMPDLSKSSVYYLRRPQTVPTCWPTFGLTCWPTCWRGLLCYIFPSKEQPTLSDFQSFACWLSIKNARVWSSSMFDNRPHNRWWQKNTWLNKKVDTAKREGRDVCQPCSGVIGWGYKDICLQKKPAPSQHVP